MKYKFLRECDGKIVSEYGDAVWEIGIWKKLRSTPDLCTTGFHCSNDPWSAFSYVQGEILAEVETRGESAVSDDKEAWQEMRLVKCYRWRKEDSVALAIFSAELVLHLFESRHPEDPRPREAIEAAKIYLANPTPENQERARSAESAAWSAAWSAESAWSVTWSAESAARSAESAAWSAARSAAWSAESAAWSAARSAESAARSAESAARSAESAGINQIKQWINNRIAVLPEYTP